jgi:hypothetical protein
VICSATLWKSLFSPIFLSYPIKKLKLRPCILLLAYLHTNCLLQQRHFILFKNDAAGSSSRCAIPLLEFWKANNYKPINSKDARTLS